MTEAGITDQPPPAPNDQPAVWDLVIADMHARDWTGLGRYGTRLQPFNGRDPLVDAYQEALDLAVYLRQAICERDERDKLITSPKRAEKPSGPLPPPVFASDGTRIG